LIRPYLPLTRAMSGVSGCSRGSLLSLIRAKFRSRVSLSLLSSLKSEKLIGTCLTDAEAEGLADRGETRGLLLALLVLPEPPRFKRV
jgi:hypothetical protein